MMQSLGCHAGHLLAFSMARLTISAFVHRFLLTSQLPPFPFPLATPTLAPPVSHA